MNSDTGVCGSQSEAFFTGICERSLHFEGPDPQMFSIIINLHFMVLTALDNVTTMAP